MSEQSDIEIALFEAVEAITFNPPLPIAWPNVDFTKPDDYKYLEVIHFPNDPIDYALENDFPAIYVGILQINVHWSSNVGSIAFRSIADIIAETFRKGVTLESGSIRLRFNTVPSQGSLIQQNGENFLPIRMQYRTIN